MDLYYGFILARDFVSMSGEKLPDEVKKISIKTAKSLVILIVFFWMTLMTTTIVSQKNV